MYVIGEKGNSSVTSYIEPMKENGVRYDILSGAEVTERYSKQMSFPGDYMSVYEGDSGILRAGRAVATMQVCVVILVLYDSLPLVCNFLRSCL